MNVSDINFVIGNINNPQKGSLGKFFTRLVNLNSDSLAANDRQHYFQKQKRTSDTPTTSTPDLAKNFEHRANASKKGLSFKNFASKKIQKFSDNTKIVLFIHPASMKVKKAHNIKNVIRNAANIKNVLLVTRPYFVQNGVNGINEVLSFMGLPPVDINNVKADKLIKVLTSKIKHKKNKRPANRQGTNRGNKAANRGNKAANRGNKGNKALRQKQANHVRKQSKIIKKINKTLGVSMMTGKSTESTESSEPSLKIADILSSQKVLIQDITNKIEIRKAKKLAQKVS